MATTTILSSITRTVTYPLSTSISAENNCGTVSISLVGTWTQQMITELPTINFAVYMTNGTKLLSVDFDLTTYISDNKGIDPVEPYTISLYNIPSSFTLNTTPIFNNSALNAHNALIESGMIDVFTTDDNGIVDTNSNNYGSELWTTPTQTFALDIIFDDSNIVPGSGGGGGGGTVTVDTQVSATSTNPVQNKAIYNYVNSSVATNTAYFIGTFNSVQDLENYSGEISNNDYAFVVSTDSDGNTVYNRYKYNSDTSQWSFEYSLNNSSFTAAQWATITSGFTEEDRIRLQDVEAGANKTVVDSALSTTSTNPVQNKTVNDALATKQDTIADLADIRSGASAGATAVQPAQMNIALSAKQNTLTFDTAPTAGSTNPVTSGGVYTAISAEAASREAADSAMAALEAEDRAALAEVIDGGAKNLLKITATSATLGGVDYTPDNSGGISINGTATANSNSFVIGTFTPTVTGDYAVVFSRSNYSNNYRMQLRNGSASNAPLVASVIDTSIISLEKGTEYTIRIYVANGTVIDDVVYPMICTAAAWKISQKFVPYRPSYDEMQEEIKSARGPIFGFKISKTAIDPSTAVTYTYDAVTMTPAFMDFENDMFNYGSWENVWFIKNAYPVALRYDGTEAYRLDPNDYSKKLDGTASDISDETTDLNFMMAFPKVYFKRYEDASYNYVEISDRKQDSDYYAYAHVNANGIEVDRIYLPLFKGTIFDGKLRSLSGKTPGNNTAAADELNAATALGARWQFWDHSSRELINDLLTLIGRSTDSQATFGRGQDSGYDSTDTTTYGMNNTGTLYNKGKFYGDNTGLGDVKVFGIEGFWATRWDRVLGQFLVDNVWKIKMTPPYDLTGGTATSLANAVPASSDYLKTISTSEYGSLPATVSEVESSPFKDYFDKVDTGTRVGLVGGACSSGSRCGPRFVYLSRAASFSYGSIGASPIYK